MHSSSLPESIANAKQFIRQQSKDFGKKDCYNLRMGIPETAAEFMSEKVAFGSYSINGTTVCFINESLLTEDHKKNIRSVHLERTGTPFVVFLKPENCTNVTPEREPLFVPAGYEGAGKRN